MIIFLIESLFKSFSFEFKALFKWKQIGSIVASNFLTFIMTKFFSPLFVCDRFRWVSLKYFIQLSFRPLFFPLKYRISRNRVATLSKIDLWELIRKTNNLRSCGNLNNSTTAYTATYYFCRLSNSILQC